MTSASQSVADSAPFWFDEQKLRQFAEQRATEALSILSGLQNKENASYVSGHLRSIAQGYAGREITELELGEFAHAFRERLRGLHSVCLAAVNDRRARGQNLHELDSDESVLWLTRLFADGLGEFGRTGRRIAKTIQDREERAWETFMSHGPTVSDPWRFWATERELGFFSFANALAETLWCDVLALRPRTKTPALSTAVLAEVARAFWAKDRRVSSTAEKQMIVVTSKSATVAVIDGPALRPEVLRATRTLPAHRLLRFLVGEGFRRRASAIADYRTVTVPHGFRGLAETLGLNGSKAANELRDAMEALQALRIQLPGQIFGGFLTWELRAAAPQRAAELRVTLGGPLLPEYVNGLPRGGFDQQMARKVVPVPRYFPPLIGHFQTHAPQAVLQMLVLRELRLYASDLVTAGSVAIPRARWARLADEAEVPARLIDDVVAAWSLPADEAFLIRMEDDRFTLASRYADELQTIEEGGRQENEGRARRRRSRRGAK